MHADVEVIVIQKPSVYNGSSSNKLHQEMIHGFEYSKQSHSHVSLTQLPHSHVA